MDMRFSVLTIFPEMIEVFKKHGVIAQAIDEKRIAVDVFNLRDFTTDRHRTVDDYPFGGGPGMVMKAEPFFRFYDFYVEKYGKPHVILTSPQGNVFDNEKAMELSKKENIAILCGRYEGIDERVMEIVDEEISIGDYVLTGGELAAMVIIDATSRFVPGVVDEESVKRESFMNNLLDHPVYTRPREVRGKKVPEVLLSGDHEKIEVWRRKEALKKTILKRPDLFMKKESFDRIDKIAMIELVKELIENVG
jgi:tRNA (guanine37-N1)-methyltransferase